MNVDTDYSDDIKALESFVLNNPELQQLEAELEKFNIFEAIGMVYQEIRHSRFLAFLLDPSQNHGLDDLFLKRLLMETLARADNASLSLIDIDVADLSGAVVQTEWRGIDILVVNQDSKLAITIENKIYSNEHSNQLARYHEIVRQQYPGFHYIYIFLTPDEIAPSDQSYIPMSYDTVASVLDDVSIIRESLIGADTTSLIRHYTTMLRRHIVSDSEIANLCQKIYQRHRRALDLIFEHRPDLQGEIQDYLINLINREDYLTPEHSSKTAIRFLVSSWTNYPALTTGTGWSNSKQIMLFEFSNTSNELALRLWIGPGPDEVRQALLNVALKERPFITRSKSLNKQWNSIYSKKFLAEAQLSDATFADIQPHVDNFWKNFKLNDLPVIAENIENHIDWETLERNLLI